ncbi:MAG: GTP 3',8-cyclase MoaA [Acutalibacteraceae bacterium]|nr:GTP 3',8-cyclase MoaA [Acutalibacteraceae bacterium]
MTDRYGRTIDYLRVSVTDRCNFRCVYCMPPDGIPSVSHDDILRYEELLRIIRLFAELGIKHIRLTGGEPTVRRGLVKLIREIHDMPGIESISMTTNGLLLPEMLDDLKDAGLSSVNISLDTLKEERFDEITRTTGNLPKVLEAIGLSEEAGFSTKVNCVAMRGVNDDELADIASLAKDRDIGVRFIEYMPIGKHDYEQAIYKDELLDLLRSAFGELSTDPKVRGFGPAVYYKPEGFTGSVGVISAMSHSFCETCNRVRMTPEGFLKLCLQYDVGVNLRSPVRQDLTDDQIKQLILASLDRKPEHHTFLDYAEKQDVDTRDMSLIGG